MAIDRAATLRNAEKLIRQGKLPDAIAEYVRLVEDQPGDWNLANSLSDLYARRTGREAIAQFSWIADSRDEGAGAKAAAVYKKILKLKPDHEHTLMQVSEILGSQGRYADARFHLNTLIELRKAKGDTRGALQAKIRLGSLDPEDYEGRLGAASARIEMGDKGGALSDLKEIAGELADKGRQPEAIEVLREAAKLNPHDEEIREKLLDVYLAAGDFARAREYATTIEQFRMLAAALEAEGPDEALETLRRAASLNPDDTELSAQLARVLSPKAISRPRRSISPWKRPATTRSCCSTVADDSSCAATDSRRALRSVRRCRGGTVSRREQIAMLGWSVAEKAPRPVSHHVERCGCRGCPGRLAGAAAVLQEFVTRVPNHVAALMRLVRICVDGGVSSRHG